MKTFISLLRGINVSGQKMIKMPELKGLYEELGFNNVTTYIQSGNIIFMIDLDDSGKELSNKIGEAIRQRFGFIVSVIIRTVDELQLVIKSNPFNGPDAKAADKTYVTFLEEKPQSSDIEKINHFDFLPDRFIIIEREVYLSCASGYGTTRLSNTFFENKLKVRATTRNWKTINKLLTLTLSVSSSADRSVNNKPDIVT
jgi:uncharacterized protein (DUF1697 family)